MQWQATDLDCNGLNQLIIIQEQGDNSPTVFTFSENGTPINLTGMDFVGIINFAPVVNLSLGGGLEITDAVNGELTMRLESSQTQTVLPGQYKFEIWQIGTEATPVVTPPITGVWVINKALMAIS